MKKKLFASAASNEVLLGWILLTAAVVLHIISVWHAGGLWRDEINSVLIAGLDWKETWQQSQLDTMPLLATCLYKVWIFLTPFLDQVTSFRILGLLIGIAVYFAFWWAGLTVTKSAPVTGLALLCCTPMIMRMLETLRPYGLGTLLALLALAMYWRAAETGHRRDIWIAGLIALLNIHTLLMNVFLVFAAAFAAAFISWRHGRRRTAGVLLLTGVLPVLTLGIYAGMFREMLHFSPVTQLDGRTVRIFLGAILITVGSPERFMRPFWFLFAIASLGVLIAYLAKRREQEQTLFLVIFIGLASLGTASFLIGTKNNVSPWYPIPLIVVCVAGLSGILDGALKSVSIYQVLKTVCLPLAVAGVSFISYSMLRLPQTNMPVLASYLKQHATPNDLIVINPWFLGVSFQYYYKGQTPYETIPPLKDHSIHRYDLVMEQIVAADPMKPLMAQIDSTLKKGGRVWVVGFVNRPEPGWQTARWKPLTSGPWNRRLVMANGIWGDQFAQAFLPYKISGKAIPVSVEAFEYESSSLIVLSQ